MVLSSPLSHSHRHPPDPSLNSASTKAPETLVESVTHGINAWVISLSLSLCSFLDLSISFLFWIDWYLLSHFAAIYSSVRMVRSTSGISRVVNPSLDVIGWSVTAYQCTRWWILGWSIWWQITGSLLIMALQASLSIMAQGISTGVCCWKTVGSKLSHRLLILHSFMPHCAAKVRKWLNSPSFVYASE